jgi:excisionase family DNA binding protein
MLDKTEKKFLTTAQAARILNMSVSTIKKLIFQGRLKVLKTPGGHYRILENDLFGEVYQKKTLDPA